MRNRRELERSQRAEAERAVAEKVVNAFVAERVAAHNERIHFGQRVSKVIRRHPETYRVFLEGRALHEANSKTLKPPWRDVPSSCPNAGRSSVQVVTAEALMVPSSSYICPICGDQYEVEMVR